MLDKFPNIVFFAGIVLAKGRDSICTWRTPFHRRGNGANSGDFSIHLHGKCASQRQQILSEDDSKKSKSKSNANGGVALNHS